MKVSIVTEVEVQDPHELLTSARLAYFRRTGAWAVPHSLDEAVVWLLDDPARAPGGSGYQLLRHYPSAPAGRHPGAAISPVVGDWLATHDLAADERRFRALVNHLEAVGEDGILDELIHDLVSRDGSDLNNEGIPEQVAYLVERLGWQEAEAEIGRLVRSA